MNNLMSNFSNLALTRMEMKKVTGGCGIHVYKGGTLKQTWTGYSKSQAKGLQKSKNGKGGTVVKWCCASC